MDALDPLPKRLVGDVNLSYHNIKIFMVTGLADKLEAHGMWLVHTNTIYIDDKLTGMELTETVLHELLHAVSDIAGFDWEESTVCTAGSLLTQALETLITMHLNLKPIFSKTSTLSLDLSDTSETT